MPTTDLPTDPPEPAVPKRYTSYQPGITFSLLETVLAGTPEPGVEFEYNGMLYTVEFDPTKHTGELWSIYPPSQYVTSDYISLAYENEDGSIQEVDAYPPSAHPHPPVKLAEFTDPAFLDQYEIEGKSVAWILAHQHVWKRKFSSAMFARCIPGFSFWFVYKTITYGIYDFVPGKNSTRPEGWYIFTYPLNTVDVRQYRPYNPSAGKSLWGGDMPFPPKEPDSRCITFGPFENATEILDMVRLDNKSLRDLFDTEYDDGPTLCGWFEG